ncbi:MAG TPA: hypothetical protein H9761_19860 [Candidatus Eisenbergiella merdavium]|uniref:Uncharacterized protein n=1 Tax=Candidatus Eisenbergiella merdavium TaxID=2838551 RepID=A0A9D2SSL0_9FIRM|nr:hypothetical protein [Candidatus Eisenbergiella merdavium]
MENNSAYTSRELLLLKKKRRRKKRLLILLAVLLCLLAAGGGGFFLWQRSRSASQETVQILAGENEEIVYARIDSIVGNEIETTILTENAPEGAADGTDAGMPDGAVTPTESVVSGETIMRQGPSGMGQNSSVPQNMTQNAALQRPSAGMGQDMGERSGRASYSETGETKAWQIPVGTDVITTLGVTTTFSRLSAGDVIAVLTEAGTDNILKIWIVQ